MKQFFLIVFGGLLAIVLGLGLVHLGQNVWQTLARQGILKGQLSAVGAVVKSRFEGSVSTAKKISGSSISSGNTTVKWSAGEEEDLINAAASTLPKTGDNKITADAYIVKDLSDEKGLRLAYNADRILPIASLTKLVTAEVARRLIPKDARISINKSIMATYGNTAQFRVGETFVAGDLIYPLLMVSSNDAAEAFAQSYGRNKFISAMNDFAQSVGAYRTYFADPSGLSEKNISTANDLVIIMDWLRQHDPEVIAITQLKSKTVRSHTWVNPTHFLSWSNYAGGKNGYTPEADRTAVSLFKIGEKTYAVAVLGSSSRDADELRLLEKIKK